MEDRGRSLVSRKESRQVNFRVNDSEYERLEQMAKEVGMSVPTFCKKKAQGARMRQPKVNKDGAFEIARQLRGIGNNVNQLTKQANAGTAIPNDELQGIKKELQELWQRLN